MFTHLANNEGRGVVRNIILPFIKSSTRKAVLPSTLYTNIEVSRVGKTEEELLNHYNEEDIVTKIINFEDNDRSVLTDDKVGFIKINFKRVSGKIL
jgi:pyruvate/2-oxoglutarate dehydrogenase complex dihydrolipoamide dehydrogenase (E3) component